MYKNRLLAALLFCFFFAVHGWGQPLLTCNDLVNISLDENCTATIEADQILETPCTTCPLGVIVELSKVTPPATGPWLAPTLDKTDVGKTYQVRVVDVSSGNKCFSLLKVEDKVPPRLNCNGLTTVNLGTNGSVTLQATATQAVATDACTNPGQFTFKLANNQTSVNYNCNNRGINQLQVTVSDASGNTASCQTAVLVDDPNGNCAACIECPPAQVVSFEQGINVLLPALQSNNLTAFEGYGYPEFNVFCPGDTNYTVAYHPSALGHSWFTRRWEANLSGQVTGSCEQVIVFPFARTIAVSGKVYVDSIANCQIDPQEKGLRFFRVSAKKLPSNQEISVFPDANGNYSLSVVANGVDSVVEVRLLLPNGVSSACPTVLAIPVTTPQPAYIQNFGLQGPPLCPLNQVSISSNGLRRCFSGRPFYVNYCNLGYQPSPGTTIDVQFDPLITVNSADLPYTAGVDNTYTFTVGNVQPFTCKTFQIKTTVSCDAVLGQTLCTTATIYPHDPCGQQAWTGPFIETQASCEGDSVLLEIRNTGAQDMAVPQSYIVVEDIIMRDGGNFNLKAGESMQTKVPANGATWRIEAQQVEGYPANDQPSAVLEACGGLNTPGLVNAFPLNDDMPYQDIDCAQVVGSYDPNDKSATPTGYGAAHILRANTDIEYKIRFQNTGTDTAFLVVVADTLSPFLDAATLEAGVSSHPYRLDVYEGGVLHFVFNNIMLPDSNVNEAASNGFVTYRVAQKRDLPIGTVIENKAAIYFDFNEPVITNTVFHTIGTLLTVSTQHPRNPAVRVSVQPNPFEATAVLQVSGHTLKNGLLRLYSLDGKTVQNRVFEGNRVQIDREGLLAGAYFYQITDQGMPVGSGMLQCH